MVIRPIATAFVVTSAAAFTFEDSAEPAFIIASKLASKDSYTETEM